MASQVEGLVWEDGRLRVESVRIVGDVGERLNLGGMPGPVVVGALGGSGTRALVYVLEELGVWMGGLRNENEDAIAPRAFMELNFEQVLSGRWRENAREARRTRDEFAGAIGVHPRGIPDPLGPWGWKNPRMMWLIPFIAEAFPGARFIHLVRDGRDMALSSNTNLLRKHGRYLLGDDYCDDPIANQARLWAAGNRQAVDAGRQYLQKRFLTVRYEDLYFDTCDTIDLIADFVGLAPSREQVMGAASTVRASKGIGRRRREGAGVAPESLPGAFAEMLRRFGYGTDG
jgi:hypothetical protein